MLIFTGPGPWFRSGSLHIFGPGLGPGPVIFLDQALVLVPVPVNILVPSHRDSRALQQEKLFLK